MKRLVVVLGFFVLFCVAGLASAEAALADTTLSGRLDNSAGAVAVTVLVYYYKSSGLVTQQSYSVSAEAFRDVSYVDTNADSPPYSITWSTGCGNLGSATLIGSTGAYFFNAQDVHCTGTNSTVTITDTSCPQVGSDFNGHVGWQVSNVANANISYFKVYKAKGLDPDTDTNPTTVNFVAGQATYSSDMPALPDAIGTWNVRVKAYPPPTNTGISVDSNNFTCGVVGAPGGSVIPPTVLTTFATGCSTAWTVTFTWVAATPGTFNYRVYVYTDPAGTIPVSSLLSGFSPNPATNAYTSLSAFLTSGNTYYWKVKASPQPATGQLYWSASPLPSFTVPSGTCVSGSVTPPVISSVRACYNMNVTSPAPNPEKVNVSWTSASGSGVSIRNVEGTNQEFVDWSSDSTFMPGSYSSAPHGPSYTIGDSPTYNFSNNQTYYFRVSTQMTDLNWYFSQIVAVVIPADCNSADQITLTGYIDCENTLPYIHLRWNKLNGYSGNFLIQRWGWNGSIWDWAQVASGSSFYYDSLMLTLPSDTWRVTNSDKTKVSNPLVFSNPCGTLPGAVDTMNITTTCDTNNNPVMNFSFIDRSTSETQFHLEVTSDPFTGPLKTKLYDKWATKVITRTAAEKTATGGVVNFSWSNSNDTNTSGKLWAGDANPHTDSGTGSDGTANNLIPLNATGYWWRVKAVNSSGSSAYNYNDGSVLGTPYPSGIPLQSSRCRGLYDLSSAFDGSDGGSWENSQGQTTQNFAAGEIVTVDVVVTNNNLANSYANSYATKLYFYYKGGTTPACSSTSGTLNPSIPVDGASVTQSYDVSGIPKGGSVTVHVTFNVGSTPESFTALAYVVPTCNFLPDDGTDMVWSNNLTATGFTYTVGVSKFFETTGGDVGAAGTLSVGVDSSALTSPYTAKYQSQYLLAAGSVSSTAKTATGGFRLAPYSQSGQLVASSGVYNYFADKFRSKATALTCNLTNSQYTGLKYCGAGNSVTISSDTTLGAGTNAVFFIDGNLNINAKLMLPAGTNDAAVYIVKGDIKVDSSVTQIDGVFIARKSFSDCVSVACAVGDTGQLTINGSVYADGEEGDSLNLGRYFSTIATNATTPSEIVKFAPKYLVVLSTLLASADVGWKEVAP